MQSSLTHPTDGSPSSEGAPASHPGEGLMQREARKTASRWLCCVSLWPQHPKILLSVQSHFCASVMPSTKDPTSTQNDRALEALESRAQVPSWGVADWGGVEAPVRPHSPHSLHLLKGIL